MLVMSVLVVVRAKWLRLGLVFALLFASRVGYAQERPDVRVEYFGMENGYTVGGNPVTLLCVVRNRGRGVLAPNTLRLRLNTMQGLDYTQGELRPLLPEMTEGQAIAYRWVLSPLSLQINLMVGVVLEKAPAPLEVNTKEPPIEPQVVVSLLPRFINSPALFTPNLRSTDPPRARAGNGVTWVGNDRVGVQILATTNRNSTLFLQGRVGKEWQTVAFAPFLAEVSAAEEGQVAWTESFRLGTAYVSNESDGAALNLQGAIGKRWTAEILLTAPSSTGAIQGRLRLTAKRNLRVFQIRPPLLIGTRDPLTPESKANGTPIAVNPFVSPIEERTPVSALLANSVAYGVAWTNTAPISDWHWQRTPIGDAQRAPLLGVAWIAPEKGDIIAVGTTLEIPFRLLAIGESQSVQSAAPFALP